MAAYVFFKLTILLFSILPWCLIYPISRFFAFLLRSVIRYRHNMLLDNLKISFPLASNKDIRRLHRSIYRQYTEILCENIKTMTYQKNKIASRVEFENLEAIIEHLDNGQHCIALTSHFANWEWHAFISRYLKHRVIAVHKKVHNQRIENMLQKYRNQWNIKFISTESFGRYIIKQLKQKDVSQAKITWLLSDQNPTREQPSIKVNFLNRETRFILNPEKLAKRYNLPVFHMQMTRIKRGHYRVTANQYPDNNSNNKKQSITQWYAEELEKQILENPASWLWLHNRWKKR